MESGGEGGFGLRILEGGWEDDGGEEGKVAEEVDEERRRLSVMMMINDRVRGR